MTTPQQMESLLYAAEALREDQRLDATLPERAEILHIATTATDAGARFRALDTIRDALALTGHDEDALVAILADLEEMDLAPA